MRYLSIFAVAAVLTACASIGPENNSGIKVSVNSVKSHDEGIDITVKFYNPTDETIRLFPRGSVAVLLDGKFRFNGRLAETLDVEPRETQTAKMQFRFLNNPRVFQSGLVEITPTKLFESCVRADHDPLVEEGGREPSNELSVQSETCDRKFKKPIRIGF